MTEQTQKNVETLKNQMNTYKTELDNFKKMKTQMSDRISELKKKEKQ